jgi:hypothetical protein
MDNPTTLMLRRAGWVVAVVIGMVPCIGAAQAVQQAQQLMADGKQAEAVRFIDQQLVQRGGEKTGDERYQLLMLKGEALIQSNKTSMAATAFDQARRAAPDGRAAAIAGANVLLVRASPGNRYAPKKPGAEPIDIVRPESRPAAFDALRDDMATVAKPKIARAAQGKSLAPAMELLPNVFDIASLELASKGSIDETRADVASMGEHARVLMRAQMDLCQRRINTLGDMAFSVQEGDRRGLQSNEVKELTPMIAELRRIEKTARDVRRRAQELGNPGAAWEQIAIDAADLADAAERIAEAGAPSIRN